MSDQVLFTVTNGDTVEDFDHNSIVFALGQDVVPRTLTGVPGANLGSLGDTNLTWLNLF